jgi:hypothetical protein
VGLLPRPLAVRLAAVERYGMFILIGIILLSSMSAHYGYDLNIFSRVIGPPFRLLFSFFESLAGL